MCVFTTILIIAICVTSTVSQNKASLTYCLGSGQSPVSISCPSGSVFHIVTAEHGLALSDSQCPGRIAANPLLRCKSDENKVWLTKLMRGRCNFMQTCSIPLDVSPQFLGNGCGSNLEKYLQLNVQCLNMGKKKIDLAACANGSITSEYVTNLHYPRQEVVSANCSLGYTYSITGTAANIEFAFFIIDFSVNSSANICPLVITESQKSDSSLLNSDSFCGNQIDLIKYTGPSAIFDRLTWKLDQIKEPIRIWAYVTVSNNAFRETLPAVDLSTSFPPPLITTSTSTRVTSTVIFPTASITSTVISRNETRTYSTTGFSISIPFWGFILIAAGGIAIIVGLAFCCRKCCCPPAPKRNHPAVVNYAAQPGQAHINTMYNVPAPAHQMAGNGRYPQYS